MHPLLLLTLLSASDLRLDQGEKLLAARDCEGLHALFAPAERPAASPAAAARLLVRGASTCRKQDTLMAFALTERALALAPDDVDVRTAHAESLLSVEERTAAARLLDETLHAHPKDAVRAQLLRAQLASEESESALVVRLAESLVNHPEHGAQARALLARHQTALQSDAEAREALAREEHALAERAAQTSSEDTPRAPRAQSEAWSTRGTLKTGGQRTFRTRNIQAGFTYIFHATGSCTAPAPKGRKSRLAPPADLFGQDFRVRIGTQEPLHLKVGLKPERNTLSFHADEDNPQIFLEDRTGTRPGGPHCTISDVAVRVP
ncbi:hypothetical protein POL68_37980 [Stigmatella sp. ncwal1]|uniref:Tetratricopeptide repeat protein n=1 Tax=Stigmatella ashevillensis TaxID=2995309 RepID=A0ABT5DKW9_9BACT|nr:hypothetical protein [Stigmatella ashevillena]MDC0714312.1 hypothetical protein [Stigmatella ashevillena]